MIQHTIMPFGSKLMERILSFFFFFVLIINIQLSASPEGSPMEEDCPSSTSCSDNGPIIQFPFRLKDHPSFCGYPGFELYCRNGYTVLKLPVSGEFLVTDIYYEIQALAISDPNDCLPRRLLDLNLSSAPFYLYNDFAFYGSYDFKFVNCSIKLSSPSNFFRVPCLSDLPGYFYIIFGRMPLEILSSSKCRMVITDPFTLSYSYGNPNQNFEKLYLRWNLPACRDCYSSRKLCRLNGTGNDTKCKSKAKKKRDQGVKIEKFLEEYKALKPARYSYAEIRKMTKCFKNKLGQGSYGNVFKGKLSNGVCVAVKVLKSPTVNGEEFINEVGTIGRIHHINIVRLLGFCIEGSKQALVYEFMQNESLEKLIFIQEDQSPLFSWRKLQEIAIGIARGMEYLHQGCDQRILHFDIKPHNILLDHKFTPKISDFGLAKLCSKEKSIVSMSTARGTMGYIAPEIFLRNFKTVSHKSDVYSFGMLLLEMVGGRKNNDTSRGDDNQTYFPEWIYNQLAQGEELGLRIEQAEDFEIAKKLTITALWCIQWSPNDRPTMTAVIHMLEGSFESLSLPPNPFSSCIEREKIRASTNISQESNLPVITE